MTLAAWLVLIPTWIFIGFYTIYFFIKVLKSPHLSEHIDEQQHALNDEIKH